MSPDADSESKNHGDGLPVRADAGWPWLPTLDGAIRRGLVTSFTVERIDGDFKGGHKSLWTIHVKTAVQSEAVQLRPVFSDADELCSWVDLVFPGSAFALLEPSVVTGDSHPAVSSEGGHRRYGFKDIADAIRALGDGLAGGNAYEPEHGGGASHPISAS
jgi:hypothetical protein